MVRNDGAFLGESLYVLGLFFEETHRNKEWEIRVLVACVLEHLVQNSLHIFPNSVAPRLDHHATADC